MTDAYAASFGPEFVEPVRATSCSVYYPGTSNLYPLFTDSSAGASATSPIPTNAATGTTGIDASGNITIFGPKGWVELLINNTTPRVRVKLEPDPLDIVTGLQTLSGSLVDVDVTGTMPTTPILVLNPSTMKWRWQDALSVFTGGSVTANAGFVSGIIFQGTPATGDSFAAGLAVEVGTVIKSITCRCVGAPAGSASTISWYKRGPSTGGTIQGYPGSPVATSVFSVPVSGGAPAYGVKTSSLAILMGQFDSLVPFITTTGTAPSDITAFLELDPNATAPTPCPAPTSVVASISGQPNNTVAVTWAAPTVPAGETGVQYAIASTTNGTTQTVPFGTNSVTMTGQAAAITAYHVTPTTAIGITQIVGTQSADSNTVTPTTSSSARVTASEAQGQGWALDTGPGTVGYASGTTLSVTASMTTTNTSTAVTGTFSPAHNGMTVTGTGIPATTTFTYLTATTGTLSHAATASGTITATFTGTGVTGSLLVAASGAGSVQFVQSTPKPMTAGEGPKQITFICKNNSGAAVLVGLWVACLDGSAFFLESSSPVYQQSVAAGASVTYTTTETTTAGGVVQGKLYGQVIANGPGDSVSFSCFTWAS